MRRDVRLLRDDHHPAGESVVPVEAGDLASGVYFIRLDTGGGAVSRKWVILR